MKFLFNYLLVPALALWFAFLTGSWHSCTDIYAPSRVHGSAARLAGAASAEAAGSLPGSGRETAGKTTTIVDSLKNTVTIPRPVRRIASMRSGITEIICALGCKDRIIAVEEMVKGGSAYGDFISGIYPDLKDCACPLIGHDINVEEMLRLGPDLVLHGGFGRIRQADVLRKQVPHMPLVIAHFETIEDYPQDIRIVARCVQAEDRAEKLIDFLQSKLAFVAQRVKDIPASRKVRVFYGGHDIYHAYGGKTFEHCQIVAAGGVNVAEKLMGWSPEVSPEQLLSWDPQVIVLLQGNRVNKVLQDTKLSGLSAVRNRRVYSLPESGWDYSSPRALFCIEWLASKLYPERFSDIDIQEQANDFYQKVFGVNYRGPVLTEAQARAGSIR